VDVLMVLLLCDFDVCASGGDEMGGDTRIIINLYKKYLFYPARYSFVTF
jgi:hypothetical protein